MTDLQSKSKTSRSTVLERSGVGERYAWIGPMAVVMAVLLWFYGAVERYGLGRDMSAFGWLSSAWNEENDFEHGPLFPLIIIGLVAHRFRVVMSAAVCQKSNLWGLVLILAAALLYAAAYRTYQPRVAVGALPILLWGGAVYLWGWTSAKWLILPLFFFWLAIPVPAFQQATNQMQLMATSMAHHGSTLFGVETIVNGTEISSAQGNWKPLEIAKGCSGIRSLMALLMISGTWACIVDMSWWKRSLLFLSAVPLAVFGNALRVISIFVIAEYGNADWAVNTWHDWSGLLLFYPISLVLLLCLHAVLEGGLPWKQARKRALRRVVITKEEAKPFMQES